MRVYQATLILSDDDGKGGAIHTMDAIKYDGRMWLVPEWLDYKDEKVTMPARIVCLDSIPHNVSRSKIRDIVVDGPVPRSVFEGRIPPGQEGKYLVIERPDIRLPIPTEH